MIVKHFSKMKRLFPQIDSFGLTARESIYEQDAYRHNNPRYQSPFKYEDNSYHEIIYRYANSDTEKLKIRMDILESHFSGLKEKGFPTETLLNSEYLGVLKEYLNNGSEENNFNRKYFSSTADMLSLLHEKGFHIRENETLSIVKDFAMNRSSNDFGDILNFYNDNVLIRDFRLWKK